MDQATTRCCVRPSPNPFFPVEGCQSIFSIFSIESIKSAKHAKAKCHVTGWTAPLVLSSILPSRLFPFSCFLFIYIRRQQNALLEKSPVSGLVHAEVVFASSADQVKSLAGHPGLRGHLDLHGIWKITVEVTKLPQCVYYMPNRFSTSANICGEISSLLFPLTWTTRVGSLER